MKSYKKEWQSDNPEKLTEQRRKDAPRIRAKYALSPERGRAQAAAWAKNNPVRRAVAQQRRRAALRGAENTLSKDQWEEILEYFGHACAYCLRQNVSLTMDHVTPVSRGGGTTPDNIIPACRSHNSKKGDRGILRMVET